ncbi:hypothetical protein MKX03_011365 [Papaver bracteatum]|nr:hypothetical protein MKX03_011365 [Papaver bracteatum]
MEARARRYDPVHGLGGIAKALSQKLHSLTSELAFVYQQIQFHRHHSGVMQQEHRQVESNEASPSPLRAAVPFSSLQECGSSSVTVSISLPHICAMSITRYFSLVVNV